VTYATMATLTGWFLPDPEGRVQQVPKNGLAALMRPNIWEALADLPKDAQSWLAANEALLAWLWATTFHQANRDRLDARARQSPKQRVGAMRRSAADYPEALPRMAPQWEQPVRDVLDHPFTHDG